MNDAQRFNLTPAANRFEADEASEFSWGRGLVPKGCEYLGPADGGMYRPLSPPSR